MGDGTLERLASWEREEFAALPTRLLPMPRMAASLGASDLWVKMDAETGFALGGNKVRKLEFELAPSRLDGVTHLLTAGGPQSNHCRVTAAAAARLGLGCTLVLSGPEPVHPTGNALLHRLFNADVVTVADRAERTPRMEAVAEALAQAGERPLVVPIGASTGLGCLGYVRAAVELVEQLDAIGPRPPRTVVFVPTSSCGTLAGLLLGMSILGRPDVALIGVSADAPADELMAATKQIARDGARLLAWEGDLFADDVAFVDTQVGDGYGVSTPASLEAIALFGQSEGLVLDPTYTAKAAAGMLEWLSGDHAKPEDRVVFLHTGGHPGLLA
ncbi:MAG: pyridoxal-phosphate dependent enzyme [Gemmatimonadetes bacterium]|jgi:1-aminocyclopropane-1-carboxylate deaminase/D-cysteine desulfhydrase-like pyridoxal-dependent ACC family enzyme|nr:pyridoxal-phosphate dependent enzyme [Gemmatimonadota bacterium]